MPTSITHVVTLPPIMPVDVYPCYAVCWPVSPQPVSAASTVTQGLATHLGSYFLVLVVHLAKVVAMPLGGKVDLVVTMMRMTTMLVAQQQKPCQTLNCWLH